MTKNNQIFFNFQFHLFDVIVVFHHKATAFLVYTWLLYFNRQKGAAAAASGRNLKMSFLFSSPPVLFSLPHFSSGHSVAELHHQAISRGRKVVSRCRRRKREGVRQKGLRKRQTGIQRVGDDETRRETQW